MLGLEVSVRLILVSLGSLHSLQGVQLEMINAIMNNDAKIDFVVFMFVGFCLENRIKYIEINLYDKLLIY